MDVPQLRERMAAWIVSDYKAVIFLSPEAVGYALYAAGSDSIYLRQFFIRRDRRRMGLGRLSFEVLRREVWPKGQRLTVEVLCSNLAATSFWHSVGYRDHFVGMEIPAQTP
jgi:GNAT superfamily N-acetyltransferase